MKVYIGPFKTWIGPYQIAKALLFWDKNRQERYHKLGDWLCEHTKLDEICQWVDKVKTRKIKVKTHKWDHWSADHTLALVIHPVLEDLRKNLHGWAIIADEDMPADMVHLKDFERWQWILDEMIWAFRQSAGVDDPEENKYYELDYPAQKAHDERVARGHLFFGKFYRNLWD